MRRRGEPARSEPPRPSTPPRLWYDDHRRSKPVLLGLSPSPSSPPDSPALVPPYGEPLTSTTARVLTEVLGRPVSEVFATVNLLESPGDEESLEKIRERAPLLRELLAGRQVVALGRLAARALTSRPAIDWMVWSRLDLEVAASGKQIPGIRMTAVAALPHPSGLNRWWNDRRNREAARRFLFELMMGTGPLGARTLR